MTAYLYQAPTGVEGDITRPDFTEVEPAMLVAVSGVFAPKFGLPMAYVPGGISQWQGSNVAADFAGLLIREVPAIAASSASDANFDGTAPWPLTPKGLCVKGYVNVKCAIGTPVRGGIVYVRTVAASGKFIGDFEATNDAGNNVALPTTTLQWASDGKDGNNNAEVRVRS